MVKLIKAALGWLTGNRSYVTFLLVAAAGAWMYVQFATVRADRDDLTTLAQQLCLAAGSELVPDGTHQSDRGRNCRSAIISLAAFQRDSQAATARVLIDAMHERDRKQQIDVAAATAAANEARDAALNMEKANATIGPDDRVGGAWFAALNRLAGLRAPAD